MPRDIVGTMTTFLPLLVLRLMVLSRAVHVMAEVLAFFLYVLAEVGLVETCSDLLQLVEPMKTTKTTEVKILYLLVTLERCFPRDVLKHSPSLLFCALLLSIKYHCIQIKDFLFLAYYTEK